MFGCRSLATSVAVESYSSFDLIPNSFSKGKLGGMNFLS